MKDERAGHDAGFLPGFLLPPSSFILEVVSCQCRASLPHALYRERNPTMYDPTQLPAWKALQAHYARGRPAAHARPVPARTPSASTSSPSASRTSSSTSPRTASPTKTLRPAARPGPPGRPARHGPRRCSPAQKINTTEDRAVLHVALRNRSNRPILVDGKDVMPEVNARPGAHAAVQRRGPLAARGRATPASRSPTSSTSASAAATSARSWSTEALKPYGKRDLHVHFVSNIDGTHIAETLRKLNPETAAVHRRLARRSRRRRR